MFLGWVAMFGGAGLMIFAGLGGGAGASLNLLTLIGLFVSLVGAVWAVPSFVPIETTEVLKDLYGSLQPVPRSI